MKTYRFIYEVGDTRDFESIEAATMLEGLQAFLDIHPRVDPTACGVEAKILTKREKAEMADEKRRREKTAHGMEKMKDELRNRKRAQEEPSHSAGLERGAPGDDPLPGGGR